MKGHKIDVTFARMWALAAAFCCAMTVGAQGFPKPSKMSPWLQSKYEQQRAAVKRNGGPLRVKGRPVRNYVLTLVQSTDEAAAIRQKGGVVWQTFDEGICAAFLPMDSLGVLDVCLSILQMEANEPLQLQNDTSALIISVDKAWDFAHSLNPKSSTLSPQPPQAFTGKGVIAAVMDMGFDFTHPAFRNADGSSRIQWFWDPMAANSDPDELGVVYDTPEKVLAAQGSSDSAYDVPHGTHVMGSMAGSGLEGRYLGMAPEAEIMGAYTLLGNDQSPEHQQLFADYIKKHLEDWEGLQDVIVTLDNSSAENVVELKRIFAAADAAGKPCVVNWSFGTGYNFSDTYTLFEQVINQMLGPGRIVVTSAGNSGHIKNFLHKDAAQPMDQELFFKGSDKQEHTYYLQIRMKTEEDAKFKMTVEIEGLEEPILIDFEEAMASITQESPTYFIDRPEMDISVDPALYAGGYLGFLVQFHPTPGAMPHPEKMEGRLRIDAPVELDFNCLIGFPDILKFSPYSTDDSRGCNPHSLGTPANLERLITVGAMHHRSSFTNILGKTVSYKPMGSEEGHLVSFSSCGPTVDGRVKPDVVAPGHNILSALCSFYVKNGDTAATQAETDTLTSLKAHVFGKDYSMWAMSGTSMAAPVTSGVVALWLQANPNLTPEDIKGVIQRTSHQPEPEFSGTDKNIYYGWGEIDAYAGLLDILGIDGIAALSHHQPAGITFRMQGRTLYIDGAEEGTPVRIYATDGRLVATAPLANGCVSLPAASAAAVYAVQVGTLGSTLIRR